MWTFWFSIWMNLNNIHLSGIQFVPFNQPSTTDKSRRLGLICIRNPPTCSTLSNLMPKS
jgi:hypothetical protein